MYTDLDRLLADERVQAVSICTPNHVHAQHGILAARAGKPVYLFVHDGEIEICGRRLTRGSAPELRRSIGFLFNVPEDQLLFPTAVEDAAFGLVRDGVDISSARARARASLDALGNPPADLETVTGLELRLVGSSEFTPRGASGPQTFELTTQLRFTNRGN